jgi:hypothetical protein
MLIFMGSVFGQAEKSSGTGFFAAENGIIVTCAHVIEEGTTITVKIGNKEYNGQVLLKDSKKDLAILKIDYKNPRHFKIINFDTVNLGDKVYVLGFPLSDLLGSDIRLTDGIVSAQSGIYGDTSYFQLSAAVQPGNSGGPILNSNFEVIGVAAAKLNDMATLRSSGAIPQNINFGIKGKYINTVQGNIRLGNGNVKTMNDAINATVQIFCYQKAEQSSSIKIVNKTGFTIFYVYLSPVSSDEWGQDRLGASVLQNGQSLTISPLPLNTNNRYDIRIIDEGHDTYTKRNVRISANQSIEFSINDIDSESSSSTGSNVQNVSVRFSMPDWVKMGMTISQIQEELGTPLLTELYGENGTALAYRSPYNTQDIYMFMVDHDKNLVSFVLYITHDYQSLRNFLIRKYGNPIESDSGVYLWVFIRTNPENISMISMENEGALSTIFYIFTNVTD